MKSYRFVIGLLLILFAINTMFFGVVGFAEEVNDETPENYSATKNSTSGKYEKSDQQLHGFPATAHEYAKLVEPILGVPPKINLGAGIEIPIYVNGVQVWGNHGMACDNPSRLGKGGVSGSVLERHEGRTADGEPLTDVVWVSFGRNASFEYGGKKRVFGSVQMIGYHKRTGATAFFESSNRIAP